jgi:hypothetical protein
MVFKKGYCAEKAALLAVGLIKVSSLDDLEDWIRGNWVNEYVDMGEGKQLNCVFDNYIEIKDHVNSIIESLKEEIEICAEWSNYSDMVKQRFIHDELLPEAIIGSQPEESQNLDLKKLYFLLEHNGTHQIDFDSTRIEKVSLALWFYKHGENNMAHRISPEFKPKNIADDKSNNANKKTIIKEFETLTHTSEMLEALKGAIHEFWEGKSDLDGANKRASNYVVSLWITTNYKFIDNTTALYIARVIRPEVYKRKK